ncbi:TetR/AcrR family transcriptional regulator [Umezawaea tangerina]|uniref:TetR family transcriptional regulator n=1 Tax=Umezawaea tangerina TaxID=84725 RepID=A0A2T0T7C5_9PSEU|nr:TetR family transcriptional regulator [Umezawaea tangerina]PRY41570.1 TetR family transcriptional regulator [Umezawaea tangerina]
MDAKPLRRDAVESRARIISAARVVFAEHGCEVPLSEVAAAAGVGVATLSRHFDRAQLVQAVIEQRLQEHVNTADDALALAPEEAVIAYVRGLCARGLVDRSLIRTFTLPLPDSPIAGRLRRQLRQRQLKLIKAGQDAGVLRAGVVPEDLLLVLLAVQSSMENTTRGAAWQRTLAILLAGLSDTAADHELPSPPRLDDLAHLAGGPRPGRRPSSVSKS